MKRPLRYYWTLFFKAFFNIKQQRSYSPNYRVVEINEDHDNEYNVKIQMINKNLVFTMKPEVILANDELTEQFSPLDIRTLTYLGYLGINSPKYKILAKRLSEQNDKLVFAIKKKGHKKPLVKTADQILNEKDIMCHLTPEEASMVSYAAATENHHLTEKLKKQLTDDIEKGKDANQRQHTHGQP